jgi:hypothetical protein
MRHIFLACLATAAIVIPVAAFAQSSVVQPLAVEGMPPPKEKPYVVQVPSTDGFVHIRLSPDLGDDLPAVKAKLEQIPGVRIGDPTDYELTTIRDFPQTLIAVDQHQTMWDQGFDQELLDEHPYDFESHPRTVILGNLSLGDYVQPLRELVARTAAAKMLIALGQRGKSGELETCVVPTDEAEEPVKSKGPNCHSGAYRAGKNEDDASPDDAGYYTSKVVVRNHSDRPQHAALFLIDPAFGTHRLDFTGHRELAQIAPGASAETDTLSSLPNGDMLRGNFRVVTIWSEQPFDPAAIPTSFSAPAFSTSFAEYQNDVPSIGALGGGAPVLPGMAAFIAQFYSTVPYSADDIRNDVDKVQTRGAREAAHRCGASLIAPNLALTAAHCVAKFPFTGDGSKLVLSRRRIRIDSPHLGTDGTTYAISGVAVPAEYDPYCGGDRPENKPRDCPIARAESHDIALLLLRPDRGTDPKRVHVVSIAPGTPRPGTPLRTYGWGFTGVEAPGQADANVDENGVVQRSMADLQYGNLEVLDPAVCAKRMQAAIPGRTICTVPRKGTGHNVFTCVGDSGGPLVRINGKREELVGLTSFSKGCGYKDVPDVFTDATKYRTWIDAARRQLKAATVVRVPFTETTTSASARR